MSCMATDSYGNYTKSVLNRGSLSILSTMEDDNSIEHRHPPDLWQILNGTQAQDGPELQLVHFHDRQGKQHKATALNFGASDWSDVIQRGYSWDNFESFVDQRECLCVGPLWISNAKVQVKHAKTFLRLGQMYFAINQQRADQNHNNKDDNNDDHAKPAFLPLLNLFSFHQRNKVCSIYCQAKTWISIIRDESEITLNSLRFSYNRRIDATTLYSAAAITNRLILIDCSIVSTTNVPYPSALNHLPNSQIQVISLSRTSVDAVLLSSFIRVCSILRKLTIMCRHVRGRHYTPDQWMALMTACSGC